MHIRKSICLASLPLLSSLLLVASVYAQPLSVDTGGINPGFAAPLSTPTASAPHGSMQPNLGQSAPTGISNPATASPSTLQQAASAAEAKALQDTLAPSAAQAAVRQEGPNQFQRFVQSSTGRLLPVFGHDFFTSPGNYASNSALPVPDDYQLGPGDEVILRVTGPVDFATNLVIDRNGQVTLPKVGTVTLTGTRARDLNKTLSQALAKVFTNFSASATLGRLRAIQVYVVGQARRPGTFQLSSLSTLVNALFASGGPGNNGSMRAIELKRDGITLTTIDLYDFIARGDKAQDRALMNGDVIFIPPAGPRMAVTGAIDQAAIYELKPGQNTIESILSLSGGVSVIASARKAQWERIDPKQNPQRVVQTVTLDKPGMQNILQDGDVLTLFGVSPAFANAVTLQGNVASPLRYSWFEGMRILDLIPERDALITADYYKRKNLLVQFDDQTKDAGAQINNQVRNLFDQINWDYAVIQRLDKKTLASQLIPFNLGQAVLEKNPSQNLPLLAGDVVTVLGQSDIRVPLMRQSRLVRIEGEVRAPGIYQVSAGETLPQLLIRAGGLTPQAYLFGTEFKRESVRQQQQQNVDKLIRRLESQSLSQQSYSVANRATDANGASQAALILQQQQAQLKDQISRLKSLKSNGRVALELDPQSSDLAALPPMALEDADHITIPPTPGFVSALGSVNNENVFIFRAGKTVGDVLKSAGLTEESDPSQAFVLRADGSIVAKSSTSGFFGSSFDTLPLMPGDTVVVPAQLDRESRYTSIVRGVKDWTQILSNFGIGAAALKSLGY